MMRTLITQKCKYRVKIGEERKQIPQTSQNNKVSEFELLCGEIDETDFMTVNDKIKKKRFEASHECQVW